MTIRVKPFFIAPGAMPKGVSADFGVKGHLVPLVAVAEDVDWENNGSTSRYPVCLYKDENNHILTLDDAVRTVASGLAHLFEPANIGTIQTIV